MYLIRSSALNGLEKMLTSFGYNINKLDGLVDLNLKLINKPNHYLPYERMAELLELCAKHSGCPYLGFSLANFQGIDALDDLIISVSHKENLGKALREFDRYLYLHANGVHVVVVPCGSKARIEARFQISSPYGIDQLAQLSVGIIVNILTRLTGSDGTYFKLHLRQAAPEKSESQNYPYKSQVIFSSEYDCVVIDSQRLKQKPCLDPAETQKHFNQYLSSLQEKYPDELESQVKEIIGGYLATGLCDIKKVAASLGLHPRALQRHLKLRGTSYRELLRSTRQAISEQYLRHSQMSVTNLAYSLGYSDVAVFSRHFKLWSGMSPRDWRNKH